MTMKNKIPIYGLLITVFLAGSCQSGKNKSYSIEDCTVVAQHVITSAGDTLTVCDITLLKDTLILPLSSLVSDFEVIHLDNDNDHW